MTKVKRLTGSMSLAGRGAFLALGVMCAAGGCKRRGPAAGAAEPIQWTSNARLYRARQNQVITVACPPGGTPGTVWGTDMYTDDSSICTAALHSGRVDLASGGVVQIQMTTGRVAYTASMRNGVTTLPYPIWPGSFIIVGGAAPGLVAMPVGSVANSDAPSPWQQRATPQRGQIGRAFTVACTPGGMPGSVWGTDVYTDDSSICAAAVHAGRITAAQGGTVSYYIQPGQASYMGTSRNGITTSNYGSFPGSFSFDPQVAAAPPMPMGATPISWSSQATQYRGQNGSARRLACPPGGSPGSVWGSGSYTDDSRICVAAVHAGRITMDQGGAFTLTPGPGQTSYMGSTANGVTTMNYGTFAGSFTLSQ